MGSRISGRYDISERNGFAFCDSMIPVLKDLYPDDKEELQKECSVTVDFTVQNHRLEV